MNPCISVKKRKTSALEDRLFFVLPKMVIPKAAARNKIKRRARAVLAPFLKAGNCGYTVVVRKGAEKLDFEEFKAQILENTK